jgi:hypothetical protein
MGIKDRTIYQTFIKLARAVNSKLERQAALDFFANRVIDNEIIVKEAADLAGSLDSEKIYIIDGIVDMGVQPIEVPQGGLAIQGLGFGVSKLISTNDNYTMFVDDGVYAGDLFLNKIEIEVSGTNSDVFDLDNDDNFDAVEFLSVNFLNCTCLGAFDSYRQGLWQNVGFIGCVDGLLLHGSWAGFAALTSIIVGDDTSDFTGTLFKEGTAFDITGSFRTDMNALGINATGAFCDFQPSNVIEDAGMLITGLRTDADDAFPNMPASSEKVKFTDCRGIPNTYVGITSAVATQGTTSGLSTGVYVNNPAVLMTEDQEHWFDTGTGNSVEYISDIESDVECLAILSFSGGANDDMTLKFRQWIALTSSYVDVGPIYGARLDGGGGANKIENITMAAYATVNNGDRIEVWLANQTGTTNITILASGGIRITER